MARSASLLASLLLILCVGVPIHAWIYPGSKIARVSTFLIETLGSSGIAVTIAVALGILMITSSEK